MRSMEDIERKGHELIDCFAEDSDFRLNRLHLFEKRESQDALETDQDLRADWPAFSIKQSRT